jgi:IS605 OrfB family transposase
MLLCKKIRIEVSAHDAATLEFMQGKCRGLYNWQVMKLRSGEKWQGWKAAKKTLQQTRFHDPELNAVYGKLLQDVYFRLDAAMQAFFRRVKAGEKPGFPRVRPRHCFFTLCKIRSKRDHCKKGSKRSRRLSQTYQRVSQKKRTKQKDCLHKASHLIVSKVVERTLVIGDLSQRQMVMKKREEQKNRYRNRAVFNDWLLYTFVQMLVYKCRLSGKELVILDERNTSKMCSGCGRLQAMPLWKRTYRCPHEECRLEMDRDENSAINILQRFLARPGPHTGDPVRCVDVFTTINTF